MDNKRLTSLLVATLVHTGPITLTKAEAEREWEGAQLKSREEINGDTTLWVENPH